MAARNPFAPIFGMVPVYMAGRRQLLDEITAMLDAPVNNPSTVSLFLGSRGSGKTVLLSYFAEEARARGWVDVRVTAIPGMLDEILVQTYRSASRLIVSESGRRATWRTRMADIFDELDRTDTGLLITVDEVDPALDEMVVLVTAVQHFLDEGRNVSLLMAGLPYALTTMLAGRSTSFLRRAAKHDLSRLADYEVEAAFRATLESAGVGIGNPRWQRLFGPWVDSRTCCNSWAIIPTSCAVQSR
jgi:hypothetical protein